MKEQESGPSGSANTAPAGGVTGVFGAVPSATKPTDELAPGPPMHEVIFHAPAKASLGDTEPLRRILEDSRSVLPPAERKAVEAPATVGFTQLLRTLSQDAPPASLPVAPAAPESSNASGFTGLFEMTQDKAAFAQVAPPKAVHTPEPQAARASSSAGTGGFTALFASVAMEAAPDPLFPASEPTPAVAAKGTFTQMFESLGSAKANEPQVQPTFSSPLPVPSKIPTVLPVADQAPVSPPQAASPIPAPSGEQAGGFTQLFRALDAQPHESAPVFSSAPTPPPASAPPEKFGLTAALPATPPPADVGGITQLLRTFESEPPLTAATPHLAEAQSAARQASPPPAPGESFTQLFQSLGSSAASMPAAGDAGRSMPPSFGAAGSTSSKDAESFTRMFAAQNAQPGGPANQADSFPPMQSSGRGRYSSYDEPKRAEPQFAESGYPEPKYAGPGYAPSAVSQQTPVAGGLTQLLRTLDDPPVVPVAAPSLPVEVARNYSESPASSSSGATSSFSLPSSRSSAARPPTAPVREGPGEFTRLINASALRESLRQSGQVFPAEVQSAPVAPAPAMAFPEVPGYPALPSMPQMPRSGGSPMQMPHLQAPPMQMPQAPAIATVVAPAAGGKAWLPILLIAIIVLLVGILLAVLLMKK